jgi:tetratricopeptide (TPR) repeat protein
VNLRNLGLALYLTHAYGEAVGWFEQAFAADSTDELNTFYLGMAHQRLGQHEEALTYFEQAKELMGISSIADIYTQMGVALEQLDRSGGAVEALELALQLDQKGGDAHYYLGRLYDKRGDRPAATRHYSEFLESVSEDEMQYLQEQALQRMQALRAADSLALEEPDVIDTLTADSTAVQEE